MRLNPSARCGQNREQTWQQNVPSSIITGNRRFFLKTEEQRNAGSLITRIRTNNGNNGGNSSEIGISLPVMSRKMLNFALQLKQILTPIKNKNYG